MLLQRHPETDVSDGLLPATAGQPALSVDVVIFSVRDHDLKVLLLRLSSPSFRGKWAIPGGWLRLYESLDEAARRELAAQTGDPDLYLEQLYTFGDPRRDPRGRVISVAYFSLVGAEVGASQEAGGAGAAWHSVYSLPELVFDHGDILRYALQRLRYKLEYTSVGFELLPNEFTLSELQAAYQIVLGEELDKRNFRRRILEAGVLAETNRFRESEGQGRPARLYRYRKNAVTEVKARRLFP